MMLAEAPRPEEVNCLNGSRIRIECIAGSALGESFKLTLLEGKWMDDYTLMDIVSRGLGSTYLDTNADGTKTVKLRHRP